MLGEVELIDKFELLLKNPDSSWTSSGYELGTSVGNAKFSFERQSKGIQNLFLLLLMKKRLEGSAIVFIEELEQNLEPKYQRYIIEEYKSLAVGQLFITSHSPDAISHFDYKSINNFTHKEAINLQTELEKVELKEIHRANKKEFISALMSATILLVEGDSEYESFPIYSYHCGKIFSVHDIEIVRVGGKGKFEKYINIFKKFGKTVYVLIDNDPDATRKIKDISKIADVIFVSQNSYEDLIFPYITIIADKLEEVIDFSIVKAKLLEIESYDCDKDPHTDAHKKRLHESIIQQKIDVSAINSYSDLCRYRSLLIFTLHNSFASAYFARTIASLIAETGSCPKFFIRMMEHIKPKGKKLEAYGQYKNVFTVNG